MMACSGTRWQSLTQKRHHARPSAALAQSKKEAQCIYLPGVVSDGDESSDDPPDDLESRQPVAWPNISQDDLRWNKHDGIANVEQHLEASRPSALAVTSAQEPDWPTY